MATTPSPRRPTTRGTRKSIAHLPSLEKSLDRENQTINDLASASQPRKSGKHGLRSQSLGGGELQALKEATGNPQKIQPLPRSILKPSLPLSPTKGISKDTQPSVSPSRITRNSSSRQSGLEHLPNPFHEKSNDGQGTDSGTVTILKTEEEQQAAAREKGRQEAQQRREERRKSLANRRVSFAPEATLHTWNVVELAEDATSSSEATNSTRRASSGSSLPASPYPRPDEEPGSDISDTPSTPESEIQVAASPADQRNLHRKKMRRSSGIRSAETNEFSSSPISSVTSDDTGHGIMATEEDIVDDSDTDDDTVMEAEETVTATAIDNDDTVDETSASQSSASETSGQLDRALREATHRASMQRSTNYNPTEVIMDLTNENIDFNIDPSKNGIPKQHDQNLIDIEDDEVGDERDNDETPMDVTQAVGSILPAFQTNDTSANARRRRSSRRRSSVLDSDAGDETMDFTTAVGGIEAGDAKTSQTWNGGFGGDEDGEMTMELTTAVGGVSRPPPLDSDYSFLDDNDMDMTMARGGILSPVTERTEPSDESAVAMDFTAVVGSILPTDLHPSSEAQAKLLMEEEADHGQLTKSPFSKSTGRFQPGTPQKASSTKSPAIGKADVKTAQRHPVSPMRSPARKSPVRQTTPLGKVATPSKQATPQPARPTTPSKTPPAKSVSMRKTSPKALFKHGHGKRASNSPTRRTPETTPKATKSNGPHSGGLPQNLVLTPRSRRTSGTGIDQTGLGSPSVAAVLDRRASIGDQAATFTPQGPGVHSVRFADPREMEVEVDQERAEEQRRESGRGVMQMEVNQQQDAENDTTSTLRDMIDGLTPKKNKLNGRKSLAIGTARGLLGKRPAELDDDDDEDATPKRLKGKDHSPVKKIHLPAPPSKNETTGRLSKGNQLFSKSMVENVSTPLIQPSPRKTASTPQDQGRFKDTKAFQSAEKPPVSFNDQLAGDDADLQTSIDDGRIHLRDFLNMTSIRFMELTTTKRRHTVLPGKVNGADGDDTTTGIGEAGGVGDDRGLAACVIAGASTIPMLELYQHSCRELKKYISEGRSIVKEIEDDTYEESPPLFREYMSATPQVRAIMDNQFKNVKTHARLLSKAMWYEWRMKLLDGLKEGLAKIEDGLNRDKDVITKKEKILEPIMSTLLKEHESLRSTAIDLQTQADELASCDPEELQATREELTGLDDEIAAIKRQVSELQGELDETEQGIETAKSRKAVCMQEIKDAEQVREQYRGWSAPEVAVLKARVDDLERSTGWKVSSAQESFVTLTYKSSLSVYLAPSSFKISSATNRDQPNSPISLSYVANNDGPSTTERFFLQLLRARVLCIPQCRTALHDVLKLLGNGWKLAQRVSNQVADLKASWPTEESIRGDDCLRVTSILLLRDAHTKVEASFEIVIGGAGTGVRATLGTDAVAVYGQELKNDKMAQVIKRESGVDKSNDGIGTWAKALGILEEKVTNYLKNKQS